MSNQFLLQDKYKKREELITLCFPKIDAKMAAIHKWYGYPSLILHPDLRNKRVCLTCHDENVNTIITDVNSSTSTMIHHLRKHREQYELYVKDKLDEDEAAKLPI